MSLLHTGRFGRSKRFLTTGRWSLSASGPAGRKPALTTRQRRRFRCQQALRRIPAGEAGVVEGIGGDTLVYLEAAQRSLDRRSKLLDQERIAAFDVWRALRGERFSRRGSGYQRRSMCACCLPLRRRRELIPRIHANSTVPFGESRPPG